MKNVIKILMLCVILFSITETKAQAPEAMNYQATVRNAAGELMINESVTVIFEIRETSDAGTSVYNETQMLTTNDFGGFAAIIGEGTVNSGNFSLIDWANDLHFLNVNVDGNDLGTSQLQSVAYSLHAKTAESITDPLWDRESTVEISTQNRVLIGTTINDNEILKVNADVLPGNEMVDFYVNNLTTNEDVLNLEVGVASTYDAQFIECRYDGDLHFKVDVDGTTLVNEINTTPTGDANLVPIAYGNVNANGTLNLNGNTGNLTITKATSGYYIITVAGETLNFNEYVVTVSPRAAFSGPIITNYDITTSGIHAGKLQIYSNSLIGAYVDNAFSFIIYKP